MLSEPHIKERLSMAYVDAVAGRAGINVSRELHDYGVDGMFQSIAKTPFGYCGSGFTVHFQLKATQNWTKRPASIVYDLDAKAYANMVARNRSAVPLVLIVMCLPKRLDLWLSHNDRELVLRNCCYWYWLPGGPAPTNNSTIRVNLPTAQQFTTDALTGLLSRAREYAMGERDDV